MEMGGCCLAYLRQKKDCLTDPTENTQHCKAYGAVDGGGGRVDAELLKAILPPPTLTHYPLLPIVSLLGFLKHTRYAHMSFGLPQKQTLSWGYNIGPTDPLGSSMQGGPQYFSGPMKMCSL